MLVSQRQRLFGNQQIWSVPLIGKSARTRDDRCPMPFSRQVEWLECDLLIVP